MTKIVKTVSRLVISFIFLYGLYIVIYGHITPGGGFAGGVFISIAYVLMMLAFSKKVAMRKLSNFAASLYAIFVALSIYGRVLTEKEEK